MENLHLKASAFPSIHRPLIITRSTNTTTVFRKPEGDSRLQRRTKQHILLVRTKKPVFSATYSIPPVESDAEKENEESRLFDWYAHWYPVVPICDLDKRRPHGKKVLGIDIVIWWDRSDDSWKVFDDTCPHRLAPLSEGRIDQWGRLQCVYHGWCFGGAGDCKFIPQAPRDGPPIHTSKRACVAVYPSCVQNGILWFWPNSDPLYKDIYSERKPHYIPELDDPSFTKLMVCRDIPYGYEVLIENLMDPSHVRYAHYGLMRVPKTPESMKADREGGIPMEINLQTFDVNGFTATRMSGENFFVPPCLYYSFTSLGTTPANAKAEESAKKAFIIFYCIPVSPGNSRLIYTSPRNFAVLMERIFPDWIFHIRQNLILDSDLYLLHVEEKKLIEVGASNWHKSCYVPTKADALVVAYRRWLNKYGGTQVDWKAKYTQLAPKTPVPPREQLFDRYWTHTVKCRSCSSAYKQLQAINIVLQVLSLGLVGIVAASKQSGVMSVAVRYGVVGVALVCFVFSKWLSHFIYRTFHYHDYDHAFR